MRTINTLSHNEPGAVIDVPVVDVIPLRRRTSGRAPLAGTYVTLLLFMFIYCARPEDWVPGLSNVPLAKITGALALLAFLFSLRHFQKSLPAEVLYLTLLIGQLFLAALLSPVYRRGALYTTLDFSKIVLIVIVIIAAVNTRQRLRLLICIQAASVAVIAAVAALNGHQLVGRLEGALGGNYSNSNDLALMIAISLPLCLALLFLARSRIRKAAWAATMLMMMYVLFLAGSRAAFLSIIAAAAVCLWGFAIRLHRRYLIIIVALVGITLWQSSSDVLFRRFKGTFDPKEDSAFSYGSAQQRRGLFWRSIEVTKEHPLFGIGAGNFAALSGSWHVTHNSFTEMSSEGGVPAFILYGVILWCGFKNVRATKRRTQGRGKSLLLAWAFQASLAAYVIGSLFASAAYQFYPYFLVAYTTALFRITKNSVNHTEETQSLRRERQLEILDANTTDTEWS